MSNTSKNTRSVVTDSPAVVETPANKMSQLQAAMARAAELRAELDKIEKENAEAILAERTAAKNEILAAYRKYVSLASKEEVKLLHVEMFPRQKSGKPRKPRAKKNQQTTEQTTAVA